MITYDAVKAALAAADPHTAMDGLVRSELAAGRRTADIFNELFPTAKRARETLNLSKDANAALIGTLDALTGDCDPDQCYQDPPGASLPTEDEIAALPRWARVALAARCAGRVLPLIQHYCPDVPEDLVSYATLVATDAQTAARHGVYPILDERRFEPSPPGPTKYAQHQDSAFSVLVAIAQADLAAHATINEDDSRIVQRVRDAISFAVKAAEPITDLTPFIRRDHDHLTRLSMQQRWTDATPVAPDVFGPLWVDGPPPGWPADPAGSVVPAPFAGYEESTVPIPPGGAPLTGR